MCSMLISPWHDRQFTVGAQSLKLKAGNWKNPAMVAQTNHLRKLWRAFHLPESHSL